MTARLYPAGTAATYGQPGTPPDLHLCWSGGFFPMPSMIGHPSGDEPLMVDVRQSGSGSGATPRPLQLAASEAGAGGGDDRRLQRLHSAARVAHRQVSFRVPPGASLSRLTSALKRSTAASASSALHETT
jgi:hypothetical protein